jgi:hypothetical protein
MEGIEMKKLTDITGQKACYSFFGENKLLDEQEKLYMQREYQAFCDWKNEIYYPQLKQMIGIISLRKGKSDV